jgi:hypothetical protein
MARLKGVIFGVENVLARKGALEHNRNVLAETGRLVRFLHANGIESVVLTNREWVVRSEGTGRTTPAKDFIEREWQVPFTWYLCAHDGVPAKQSAGSVAHVCQQKGWQPNETLFVGNTKEDMQAAVNGRLLLLNAKWYEDTMDYGFPFETPKEVARFIDVFCLRDEFWTFQIEDGLLRVYSLALFSTMFEPHIKYSEDFLRNIKRELGHDEQFWAKYLCTSVYFSGVYDCVNYITSYPCHTAGDYPEVLIDPMDRFAKCFRGRYIPDLLVRHTTATKSQTNRGTVDHLNQLNTVHLQRLPLKAGQERFASNPLKPGKTVLVIDDVCSKGMSFEAARAYIRRTGAEVICVSLLKALRHGYERLGPQALPNGAFRPNALAQAQVAQVYPYGAHVISTDAARDLGRRLRRYQGWEWPSEAATVSA